MLIAQKPDEPRAEPDPVGQEAPRQERLQFVNTRISHAERRSIGEGCSIGQFMS